MKDTRNRPVKVTKFLMATSSHDCIACWRCVKACPRGVLGTVRFLWHRHVRVSNPEDCIGCGKCVAVCPQEIFTLNKGVR